MIAVALIPGCQVYKAMNKHFPLVFPLEDEDALTEMEREFAALSRSDGIVRGCVGALDGLAIRINCPSRTDSAKAASFMNRKKFYSMNCQAICDARLRFRYFSCVFCCTHTVCCLGGWL